MNVRLLEQHIDAERQITPGQLTLRCQDQSDRAKVQKLCPRDQSKRFTGTWTDDNNFILVESPDPVPNGDDDDEDTADELAQLALATEKTRVAALADADLQALAAERGVKWNKQASRETMVKKIAEAATKPE